MSRTHDDLAETEQQIEQQQTEQPKDGGLSPEQELVLMQLATFDANSAQAVASALREHPEMRDQILEFVGSTLGNAVVQEALALAEPTPAEAVAQPEAAAPPAEEANPFIDEEAVLQETLAISSEKTPEVQARIDAVDSMQQGDEELLAATLTETPEARDEVLAKATDQLGPETVEGAIVAQAEEQQEAPPEETVAPEPLPEPVVEQVVGEPKDTQVEEAWIEKARDYNRRHRALVEEFAEHLSGNVLRYPDGDIDPAFIVAWQQANGVAVDGRIGPETVAAAREGAKRQAALVSELDGQQPAEENVAADGV